MKKNKFVLIVMLALSFCFLLTGCIKTDISVRLDGNNGGDIKTTLLIEKNFYNMMSGGSMSGVEGMTEGETTIDETEYVTFSGKKSYKTYEDMKNALLDMSFLNTGDVEEETETVKIFKSVEIKKDGWLLENRYIFNAVTNAQETDGEMTGSGMSFDDIYKLQLEIVMPGNINESKGGEAAGNTLKCDITSLTQENEIQAVSNSVNIFGIVIAVIVVILLIGLIYALTHKGKTNEV